MTSRKIHGITTTVNGTPCNDLEWSNRRFVAPHKRDVIAVILRFLWYHMATDWCIFTLTTDWFIHMLQLLILHESRQHVQCRTPATAVHATGYVFFGTLVRTCVFILGEVLPLVWYSHFFYCERCLLLENCVLCSWVIYLCTSNPHVPMVTCTMYPWLHVPCLQSVTFIDAQQCQWKCNESVKNVLRAA